MSLATLSAPTSPTLADVVDLASATCGSWVLVRWGTRLGHLQGRAAGAGIAAVDLSEGGSAWFVGGDLAAGLRFAENLRNACQRQDTIHDPLIHEQLQHRPPASRGSAPVAALLVLTGERDIQQLARVALAAADAGTRVHTTGSVIIADPDRDRLSVLLSRIRGRLPGTCGGIAEVPHGARTWLPTVDLAAELSTCALELGLPYCDSTMPAAVARLITRAAQQAAAEITSQLGGSPLLLLQSYDEEGGPDLIETVREWCRRGFSIPEAAEQLQLHANTVRYRIRRAAEVSGLDLSQPDQQIAMWLLCEQDGLR